MQRKLASIQLISALEPIPNADRIEKASILGWNVVVQKGEFYVGSKCVFFEVDCMLPSDKEWAEFLRPRGFRIKTCRLRGVLSQGLALPLSIIPVEFQRQDWKVGDEVTEILKVCKYEPPSNLSAEASAPFPPFIPKTDEMRIQSCLDVLNELKGNDFYISLKCDGTSSTFAKMNTELIACSRNQTLKKLDNTFWKLAQKHNLDKLPEGIAVQGEICGPGIQKNRLGLKESHLFIFSVFEIKKGKYFDFEDFLKFCKDYHLENVPIERIVKKEETFEWSLKNFLEIAEGLYTGTENKREGIVVRPLKEMTSTVLNGRLSFKVLNNDFLLEED